MISVLQLGTIDYATGLRLQQRLVELRKSGQIGDVLLLLEHTPVITLGRNAKQNNVLASPELLAERGVEVFECDRGGDVTFHGPGQLVGYPIFDLRAFPSDQPNRNTLGVVEYVRRLEEVLIRTCADFAIPAQRISGLTGVWTIPGRAEPSLGLGLGESEARPHASTSDATSHVGTSAVARPSESKPRQSPPELEGKVAALGIHISRGVASHGFALNVNTDLTYFDLIVPCGIREKSVTSVQRELGRQVPLEDVANSVARHFGSVFGSQILWLETLDGLMGNALGVPMQLPAELRRLREEEDTHWA